MLQILYILFMILWEQVIISSSSNFSYTVSTLAAVYFTHAGIGYCSRFGRHISKTLRELTLLYCNVNDTVLSFHFPLLSY